MKTSSINEQGGGLDALTDADKARFEAYYRRETQDECWPWLRQTRKGYGQFSIYQGTKETRLLAHRVSYRFYRGHIAPGYVINHLCGNKVCVNPFHLEPATSEQNVRHAARKLHRIRVFPGLAVRTGMKL